MEKIDKARESFLIIVILVAEYTNIRMAFNSSEIKRLICVAQLLHREFNFGRILFSVEESPLYLFYLFLRWKNGR